MGCLCSSDRNSASNIRQRSASFASTGSSDYVPGSFLLKTMEKSFYADYKLGKEVIGYGTHGEIRLCEHKITSQVFAVKIINKASLPPEVIRGRLVRKQYNLLLVLNHPSVLKLHDFYEDHSEYFIIMDYIRGGDLYEKLKKMQYFTETMAARIMKQILSALAHMHSKKIAHRDIKPENIMLEEKANDIAVKIIDFDTAVNFEGKRLGDKQGSLFYMSPEVFKGDYNEKCDLWSAGVTMYVMLMNSFPYDGEDESSVEKNIIESQLDFNYLKDEGISPEAIHLLSCLMHPNPENRFSAQEASHHGWILKYSYDPLPQPHSLCSYDALSHAIKLWAVKFIIPISDLLQYHLAFIQTDKNSNGILTKEEIQEYLGKITDSEAENLINKGYWNSQGSLDFFEFVSVMADKDFLTKYTDKVCEEVDWSKNSEIDTQEFVWYLKSKLGGIDRFENSELPSTIKKEDIATFLGM